MVELLSSNFINGFIFYKPLQLFEECIGNGKVRWLEVVSKLNRSLDLIGVEACHPSRGELKSKCEDGIDQSGVCAVNLGWLGNFIRRNSPATVHGPTCVSTAFRSGRLCLLIILN